MAKRDVIVIGGSAGSIEALTTVVSGLPEHLPAAVLVVIHVPPGGRSRLPAILTRSGPLPATHARHGEEIRPGRIYVAPPNRHLLVRHGNVELNRGPRENRSRPAIDSLFRSAARAYGPRVIGVVLSGALYDGSAGLMAVKARGGIAIVQDPEDALFPGMPRSALALVKTVRILPAATIGHELGRLSQEAAEPNGEATMSDDEERIARVIEQDFTEQAADVRADDTALYTCPDCGGVMWQTDSGPGGWFRCHVGHAYSPEVLLIQKSEELEAALWACIRLLREKATMTRQSAARLRAGGNPTVAQRIEEQALLDERHAKVIRDLLEASPNPSEQTEIALSATPEPQTESAG